MSTVNIGQQALNFLFAFLFGVALALLYDFVKVLHRTVMRSFLSVQLSDVIFCFVSSLLCFCFFMLFTGGEVRAYLLFGMALGFGFWSFFISPFTVRFCLIFCSIMRKILHIFSIPLHIFEKTVKNLKKSVKNRKNIAKNSCK